MLYSDSSGGSLLRRQCALWIVIYLSVRAFGQTTETPFEVTWVRGKCVRCKVAADLDRIQWLSRDQAWGIGWSFPPPGAQGSGDYVLVHTGDAGRTWRELPDTWQHAVPPAFWFLNASVGWFSCLNAYCTHETPGVEVRRTVDGGRHWNIATSKAAVLGMAFTDERNGIAQAFDVGDPIVRTSDGGRTWSKIDPPHLRKVENVVLLSGQTAWVTDHEGEDLMIFRTTDGGRSFGESRAPLPSDWPTVREIAFVDPNHGWIALGHKQDDEVRLLQTADGGRTWVSMSAPSVRSANSVPQSDVLGFVSPQTGFVFSTESEGPPWWDPKDRKVLFTSDGGTRWRQYPLPYSVRRCQAFMGDLLCSADQKDSHFGVLRLHPR
jgi:photosystem II stability/assembly factor-like uncharacterized protein